MSRCGWCQSNQHSLCIGTIISQATGVPIVCSCDDPRDPAPDD